MDLYGLTIESLTGHRFQWTGHTLVENKTGDPVRVERWSGTCRDCGGSIVVLQKLPRDVARKVHVKFRHARAEARQLRGWAALGFKPTPVQLTQRYGNFEVVRCADCRRARRIQELV